MKNKFYVLSAVIILVLVGLIWFYQSDYVNQRQSGEKVNQEKQLDKLTVQAGWLLNGEFANICAAIVNGYYQEEGLDVSLLPGGPSGASFIIATNTIAQNKDLDIAIEGDLVPLMRGITKVNENEKLKVKAFGAFWNELPYGFMVREDSDLHSLKDFALKRKPDGSKYKIGVTADAVIQNAIAKYAGVDVNDLDITIVGFDATPLLANQVDALAGFWTTQAYELEKAGFKYRWLGVNELPGWNQPSMIALATNNTLKNKKDQLVRWMKATIKGTKFVEGDPEAAGRLILDSRCGGPTFDQTQETWLIKKSLPLFNKDKIGWVDQNRITDFGQAYYDLGQIPFAPAASEALDYSILNAIYP